MLLTEMGIYKIELTEEEKEFLEGILDFAMDNFDMLHKSVYGSMINNIRGKLKG
jgi:hypothetical protein